MDIELDRDKELPQKVGKPINQLVYTSLSEEERHRAENKVLYGILSKESSDRVPEFLRITGVASYFDKLRDRQMYVPLGSKGIRIERPPGVVTLGELANRITAEDRENNQRATELPELGTHKGTTPFTAIKNSQLGGRRRRTRRGGHDTVEQEIKRMMAQTPHIPGAIPEPPIPGGVGDLGATWDKFGKALHAGLKSIRNALTRKRDAKSSTLGRTAGRGGRRRRTRRMS